MKKRAVYIETGEQTACLPNTLDQRRQRNMRFIAIGRRTSALLLLLLLTCSFALAGVAIQQSGTAEAASIVQSNPFHISVQTKTVKVCPAINNNPWCYNFSHGTRIYHPQRAFCSYFACVSDFWRATRGYVVECWNGKYSHSGGIRGVCSRDKGVRRTLYA